MELEQLNTRGVIMQLRHAEESLNCDLIRISFDLTLLFSFLEEVQPQVLLLLLQLFTWLKLIKVSACFLEKSGLF